MEMNEYKYRLGQVVKWKTKLRSEREEILFGKVLSFENDEKGNLWYRIEEYPEKTEYTWYVPEKMLDSVTLMEM